MKCPLFRAANIVSPLSTSAGTTDCLKEECARYDQKKKQCVDISIAEALQEIAKYGINVRVAE